MRYLIAIIIALFASQAFAQPTYRIPDGTSFVFFTNTVGTTGAPITVVSETVDAYKDGTATAIGGVAIDDDAALTGQHKITIDLTDADWVAGSTYHVYYSAGTADSISLVGRDFAIVQVGPIEANVTQIKGGTTALDQFEEAFDNDTTGGDLDIAELSVTEGAVIATSDSNETALVLTGNGTGNGATFNSGTGSFGDGVQYVSNATAGYGQNSLGSGTGAGFRAKGGITGPGGRYVGGDTSGSGAIYTAATSGHGVEYTGTGSSKHGLIATGASAGTSDGISAVASSGVPIRGDITGNITGTLSTVTTLTNLPAITSNWLTAPGMAADVTAEILAPLITDAQTEPTGAPAANETIAEKIGFLFATMRNKVTVTATEKTVHDDADAEQWDKELSDNGTVYQETEGAAAD